MIIESKNTDEMILEKNHQEEDLKHRPDDTDEGQGRKIEVDDKKLFPVCFSIKIRSKNKKNQFNVKLLFFSGNHQKSIYLLNFLN